MKSAKRQRGAPSLSSPANGEGRLVVRPRIWGDPQLEAEKAACRSLSHDEAVQETEFLQKQYRQQWSMRMAKSPVDLDEVLQTLTEKRIPFVLTGTHGISGWMGRPRATFDVDILVKGGRNHARAVKAMRELYPGLEVRPYAAVTRFYVPGETEPVLDVVYPMRADIEETLANPVLVEDKGLRYRIPSLEAALANKYGAMLSFSRDPRKRAMDAVDFSWMVKHSMDPGRKPIDLAKLRLLGELVWPGGGGEEVLRLVEQAKADKVPSIEPTQEP